MESINELDLNDQLRITKPSRRPRLVFTFDDKVPAVSVSCPGEWGVGEEIVLPLTEKLNPVARRLALIGLSEYLARNAKGDDRAAQIKAAYAALIADGMQVFIPKDTTQRPPPMPSKRRRVQALAAIYGTTVDFVTAKLKGKSEAEQKQILENEGVVKRALAMVQAEKSMGDL